MAEPHQSPKERFHAMSGEERGEVLQQHLTAAERSFKKETGSSHLLFGVETAAHYCAWLLLLAPEPAKEFLAALAAMHGIHDRAEYEDAKLRFRRAKMALHVAMRLQSEHH